MKLTGKQNHEMLHSKVEIHVGNDAEPTTFKINGVEMGHILGSRFSVDTQDTQGAHVDVQMYAEDILIKGTARVKADLPDDVTTALVAAGWTPPGVKCSDCPQAEQVVVQIDGRQMYGVMQKVNATHRGR
jgi:hypothetical protein